MRSSPSTVEFSQPSGSRALKFGKAEGGASSSGGARIGSGVRARRPTRRGGRNSSTPVSGKKSADCSRVLKCKNVCRTSGFGAFAEYNEDEAGPVARGVGEVGPFERSAGEISRR